MSEPVDITAEEVPAEPGTELVAAPAQAVGAFISGRSPEEIIQTATTVANALKQLIEQQRLAASMGGNRKHVEVGAWQACGMMLGALGGQPLHAETVWTRVATEPATGQAIRRTYTAEVKHFRWVNGQKQHTSTTTYDVDGYDWEACVEIRTPDGTVVGRAEAMCSRAEETWSKRDDFAVRSMAETRAESRAFRRAIGWIVHMAGYSPTPAEEMGHTPGEPMGAPAAAPAWTLPASDELTQVVRGAIGYLLGDDPQARGGHVDEVMGKLTADTDGTLVAAVARAVAMTASKVKRLAEAQPAPEAPAPDDEPPITDAAVVDADEANPQLGVL